MNVYLIFTSLIFLAAVGNETTEIIQKQIRDVNVTVIYDNYTDFKDLESDWGFSCFIEGKDKTILFDTGTNPEIFRSNLEKLKVPLHSLDLVVISHNHGDHTGGLPVLIGQAVNIPVYVPVSVLNEFKRNFPALETNVIGVSKPLKLCEGVFLTGELGDRIKEQALLVETSRGWLVITGCSHPGIANILDQASDILDGPIFLVMGGFHMLDQDQTQIKEAIDRFRHHQVIQCAPTHCTGDEAIRLFQEAYGKNFLRLGSGKEIFIPAQGDL